MLPLYEAKMIHHFDSRLRHLRRATEAQPKGHAAPPDSRATRRSRLRHPSRYWVRTRPKSIAEHLARRGWDKGWLLGWRDICRSTDERTVICSSCPALRPDTRSRYALDRRLGRTPGMANLCSFVLDYVARQKMAGTLMTYFIVKQLPVLPPAVLYGLLCHGLSSCALLTGSTARSRTVLHRMGHGAVRR